MLTKVTFLLPLALLCSAEPPNHLSQNPHQQKSSKHAISSQSYHRGDVPLSYEYSSVHIYTTAKPDAKDHGHANAYAHSSDGSTAPPKYYYNYKNHQSEEPETPSPHQYVHYVPVKTSTASEEIDTHEPPAKASYNTDENSEIPHYYQTHNVQSQHPATEHKEYNHPSYTQESEKKENQAQETSEFKTPSQHLHYTYKQQSNPSPNYLPVRLYHHHQQSYAAPAKQHIEYQPQDNSKPKTVVLYTSLPATRQTHTPSVYHQSVSSLRHEQKPYSGPPLVNFKVGPSALHSLSHYQTADSQKAAAVPTVMKTLEVDPKFLQYMYLLQKQNYLESGH